MGTIESSNPADLSIFLHGHALLMADVTEDGPSSSELLSNTETQGEWLDSRVSVEINMDPNKYEKKINWWLKLCRQLYVN